MPAYYNEFDPQKAAWLRQLIQSGLIAPGDVDERSIKEVRPTDLAGYTQCHFFAGIGVWSHALRLAGWEDPRAVWTASCPCQPFSAAGRREGEDDERHLWPEVYRLAAECRPDVILGEQVASKDGLQWFDLVSTDMERENYAIGAVDSCAAGYGAPHIRQRLYWVAHTEFAIRRFQHAPDPYTYGRGGSGRCGDSNRVAHSNNTILEEREREHENTGPEYATVKRDSTASGVGHSPSPGSLPSPHGRIRTAEDGPGPRHAELERPNSPDCFWSRPNWVLTRPVRVGDRPRLRPIEPGSFPLANGSTPGVVPSRNTGRAVASGAGHGYGRRPGVSKPVAGGGGVPARVLRLKGYGDAIVAPQAVAWIETVMETLG